MGKLTVAYSDAPPASLDWPGRTTLTVAEVAGRLGISVQHVLDWITEGAIAGVDVSGTGSKRKTWRIPAESWRDFVARRMQGATRFELLRQMPRAALEELLADIARALDKPVTSRPGT